MIQTAREYNAYVKHTLGVLRSQGVDPAPLLLAHGIDEGALEGEEDLLTHAQYSRLIDEIIRRHPLPGLGLLDGRGVNLLDHGLLGYAMFAAASLALGERTLRRRLADENTTYKQVMLDFRMDLAASYLRGEEISIQEIAYVAGYADPSNFHRTFARYHGMTPNTYRQQYQGEPGPTPAKDD
jgi:AraC-like DNA-binding protein